VSDRQILQPPGWPRPKGYANGIAVSGRQVFVAGMVGWNGQAEFVETTLVGQVRQALENVRAVLAEAGAGPEHIVRMTWYLLDRREYLAQGPAIGAVYREVLGKNFPAMSAVEVAGLVEDSALVEIEVTAVVPESCEE
jgi:enamine deaminase RidA (YjgF/YER057c/UK114 family)